MSGNGYNLNRYVRSNDQSDSWSIYNRTGMTAEERARKANAAFDAMFGVDASSPPQTSAPNATAASGSHGHQ
jgi:hypothetical protein